MNVSDCPSNDQLTAYLQGRLSTAEAEALEAHVAVCPQCEANVSRSADDLGRVVADAYRQGPLEEDQIIAEREFHHAVEAVQQLPGGSPPAESTRDYPNSEPRIGQIIAGRYKLLEKIGEGGMGSVYMAQQEAPVKRLVAVKVILPGMDSRTVLARFEAERQALAMMDHPNIARVLDAGAMETGRPFFVMELVKGIPITRFCDERRLTLRQRLELFVPVCQAIQHAHQKGIIHRDIKPSNVLVTMYDDRPVPKVIDFGLAKATGQALTDKTLVTAFGAQPGTVLYMSPEQASLNSLDIDTRSDVFALGVLLYELLTGGTPLDRDAVKRAVALEALRMVREEEPQRPSAKLSSSEALPSIAANRNIEPARLARLVQGELDWVALKALEKERARRYETANALARDVQRYLADEVVEARPPSAGYRLRKFVRRHKIQVIAAGLVLAALLAGIAGTTFGLIRADAGEKLAGKRLKDVEAEKAKVVAEKKKVEDEKQIAQAVRDFLQHKLLGQADTEAQADELLRAGQSSEKAKFNPTVRELLDRAALELAPDKIEQNFGQQPLLQAELLKTVGDAYFGVGEYQTAISLLSRAADLAKTHFGADARETLDTLGNLALAQLHAGNYPKALQMLQDLRDIEAKKFGTDDPSTLTTLNNLATAYLLVGKHQQAIEILQPLNDAGVKKGWPNVRSKLTLLNNLATAYAYADNTPRAIELLEQVRKARVDALGAAHPEAIMAAVDLGMVYLRRQAPASNRTARTSLRNVREEVRSKTLQNTGGARQSGDGVHVGGELRESDRTGGADTRRIREGLRGRAPRNLRHAQQSGHGLRVCRQVPASDRRAQALAGEGHREAGRPPPDDNQYDLQSGWGVPLLGRLAASFELL